MEINNFGETYTDINIIKKEANKKKDIFFYKDIKLNTEAYYKDEGWELFKTYKTKTKIKKEKVLDLQFEDKTWRIFSKLGFDEINKDRNFKIPISKHLEVNSKQIDVFVKDKNVALVIECKSSIILNKKSLRNEINEMNGYKIEAIKSIKNKYDKDLKIGFIIVTKNIILNKSDLELAKTHNIKIIKENKLDYYENLSKQIGTSSKYQLLAEIFEGQGIKNLNCKIPAIRSKSNGKVFYSFLIEPSKLLPIAFVAHKLKTDSEIKSYQRIIQKKKLEQIKKYITRDKGIFPNSIILNFRTKEKGLNFDLMEKQEESSKAKFGILHLPAKYKSAWIIDGQHRLYGFTDTEEAKKVLIPIIAFENLNSSDQSTYFVDINSKQTSVPKNLLQELYSSLFWESDKEDDKLLALISKICSDLGNDLDSPIYNKIKSSNSSDGRNVPITLNTLTDALKKYKLIAEVDIKNNKIISHKALYNIKEPCMDNSLNRAKIILKKYFNYFKEGIPNNWNLTPYDGGYLCSNNGLTAILIVLSEILKYLEIKTKGNLIYLSEEDLLENNIFPLITPVLNFFKKANYEVFKNFKSQQGASGQKKCAFELMNEIQKFNPDFNPVGLKEHLEDNDETKTKEIKEIIHILEKKIHQNVIGILKEKFGSEKKGWWYEGIQTQVRKEISELQEEKKLENPEECFNLIHYYKIIFANWEFYKDIYSILEKGIKGKKNALSWFDKFNNIRNKCSHPQRGNVTKKEYEFIKSINSILLERLNK